MSLLSDAFQLIVTWITNIRTKPRASDPRYWQRSGSVHYHQKREHAKTFMAGKWEAYRKQRPEVK